jgi:hypothetical protein
MLKVNDCSLTIMYRHSIGPQQNGESSNWLGQPSISAILLSHQSAAAVTAARQGVSDLNFDGWKTCSSDAVLLESQMKSEL